MLRDRLWTGSLLAALTLGSLAVDGRFAPWFPLLYALLAVVGVLACRELLGLIPPAQRPSRWLAHGGVQALVLANWIAPVRERWDIAAPNVGPWAPMLGILVALFLAAFLRELWRYDGEGGAGARVAWTCLLLVYLGILSAFLARLRWLPPGDSPLPRGALAMMLAVFVPKCCDIGAYAAGRLIGRTPFTPKLSPKKTWEGSIGGLALGTIVALIGAWLGPRPDLWWLKAIGFGLTVGFAGMMGDLAESLLKREVQKKDASGAIPGFGGVLDVIDSLLFAAPAAYLWLTAPHLSPIG